MVNLSFRASGLDIRAGYWWFGAAAGTYIKQGNPVHDGPDWPAHLPPLTCCAFEFLHYLRYHWAFVLGISPRLIQVHPTSYKHRSFELPLHDGGFTICLEELPLERIMVPCFSGFHCRYVPVQYDSFLYYTDLNEAVNARLVASIDGEQRGCPLPSGWHSFIQGRLKMSLNSILQLLTVPPVDRDCIS
jgi:hypothetical protein